MLSFILFTKYHLVKLSKSFLKDSTLLIDYLSNKKQQQKHSIYSPFSACMKKKAEESEPLTKEN